MVQPNSRIKPPLVAMCKALGQLINATHNDAFDRETSDLMRALAAFVAKNQDT